MAPHSASSGTGRERVTDSGIEIRPVYGPSDLEGWDPARQLGEPGHFPFTRGIRPDMYRGRLWTMRQYAGFGTAESTNERFKFLLGAGQTGLSCAFDLPTQMGYDSDHPRSEGEVGKVGVAIDSLEDMRALLAGLPLDKVTTSMTINATAAILLLFYQLVAEENGVDPSLLGGTIQNDILKEYVARGTYIYPPRPSMRLVTDTFSYCAEHLPAWNTISISGYHIREAGSTAVQEIAFTIANGIAYMEEALGAGLDVDALGGAVVAIETQYMQQEIEQAAYAYAKAIDAGEKVVVGVNKFVDDDVDATEVFPIDAELQRSQVARVGRVKAERGQAAVDASLGDVEAAARGTQNLLIPMKVALSRMATLGEVSDILRGVFGEFHPNG